MKLGDEIVFNYLRESSYLYPDDEKMVPLTGYIINLDEEKVVVWAESDIQEIAQPYVIDRNSILEEKD